jgi:hypothetical protein
MSTSARSILFLFAGALAGFLSGLMVPMVFGVRGAILGAAIAGGAVVLNPRRRNSAGEPPGIRKTLAVAAVAAFVAWLGIVAWHGAFPMPKGDFEIDHLSPLSAALGCGMHAVMMLLGYRAWHAGRWRAWPWFVLVIPAGAAVRTVAMGGAEAFPYALLLGALPFVFFWLIAAWSFDPAWTEKRWRKARRGPDAAGPA